MGASTWTSLRKPVAKAWQTEGRTVKEVKDTRSQRYKPQCQFFIGIEEDTKFRVTRKVMGPIGKHMKSISEQTGAKLRLRGLGSGFKEGLEQVESSDPLMLCVSTDAEKSYQEAVRQVWALLESVYLQYSRFCEKEGMPVPHNT